MECKITGLQYIELEVIAPASYRGWMRLYVDRIDSVTDATRVESIVLWRRTPRIEEPDQVALTVRLNGIEVRRRLGWMGWRERKPGEPAGLIQ